MHAQVMLSQERGRCGDATIGNVRGTRGERRRPRPYTRDGWTPWRVSGWRSSHASSASGSATLAAPGIAARRMRGLESDLARSTEALSDRELSSSEERRVQDLVLSSMQEGVLLIDGQGTFAFANPALDRCTSAMRSTGVTQLYPQALREAVQAVGAARGHDRGGRTRGTRALAAATAAPAGSDGSILLGRHRHHRDASSRAMRRDFVANASHELKTPTASIQAVAETLASIAVSDPAAVPRFATQLEREAKRLSRIVADLLDLSRLEAGGELGEPVGSTPSCARKASGSRTTAARPGSRSLATDAGTHGGPGRRTTSRCWSATSSTTRSGTPSPAAGSSSASPAIGDAVGEAHGRRQRRRHPRPAICRGCSSASTASIAPARERRAGRG